MPEEKLDLTRLPHDHVSRRSTLLLAGAHERMTATVNFLQREYVKKPLFDTCSDFAFVDMSDVPRSDWDSLRRVWLFPWFESQRELGECLNQCFMGAYKAAFDNCRRALELAVVGAYFVQATVPDANARAWMKSDRETPLFSRAVGELMKTDRFAKAALWGDEVKRFYWQLCDVVHTRGRKFSLNSMQPSTLHFTDVSLPQFTPNSLTVVLDHFIATVRHIATIVAIENPSLLFGYDLPAKFGLNPPLSGFFEEAQASRLRDLLLEPVREAILTMADGDEEALSVREWLDGLPQISHEEFAEQVRDHDEWLKSLQAASAKEDDTVG